MSRNFYTMATISGGCDLGLRAMLAGAGGDRIVAAERYLHEAVSAREPRVAFYRAILDGWNTTHVELSPALRLLSPVVGERIEELSQDGITFFAPDELTCLEKHRRPTVRRSKNLGWYAMTAWWESLHHAGTFASGTRCRVVVTWRTLTCSFGDEDFRPS